MLTLDQGRLLVQLARQAIATALETGEVLSPPEDVPDQLKMPCGVFVTLRQKLVEEKLLRGCIGVVLPIKPLVEATIESALNAAFRDPRFPPLTRDEFPQVTVEVSVLTPPQLLQVSDPREYPAHIRIGRDGLLVEADWQRGLLLPQVAVEHGFDAVTFLEQTCLKAGLSKDAWRRGDVKVFVFQAQVFEETEPGGEVVEVALAESKGEDISAAPL